MGPEESSQHNVQVAQAVDIVPSLSHKDDPLKRPVCVIDLIRSLYTFNSRHSLLGQSLQILINRNSNQVLNQYD